MSNERVSENLCHTCNLCCDGAFFSNAPLVASEVESVRRHGLPIITIHEGAPAIPIPCSAHDGVGCSIYPHRPERCREYRCRLLKRFQSGGISLEVATQLVLRVRELESALRAAPIFDEATRAKRQSVFMLALSLAAQAEDPDWRRQHAAVLMDIGEFVHITRRQFGVRDDGEWDAVPVRETEPDGAS
jgi:hypothetical protein